MRVAACLCVVLLLAAWHVAGSAAAATLDIHRAQTPLALERDERFAAEFAADCPGPDLIGNVTVGFAVTDAPRWVSARFEPGIVVVEAPYPCQGGRLQLVSALIVRLDATAPAYQEHTLAAEADYYHGERREGANTTFTFTPRFRGDFEVRPPPDLRTGTLVHRISYLGNADVRISVAAIDPPAGLTIGAPTPDRIEGGGGTRIATISLDLEAVGPLPRGLALDFTMTPEGHPEDAITHRIQLEAESHATGAVGPGVVIVLLAAVAARAARRR